LKWKSGRGKDSAGGGGGAVVAAGAAVGDWGQRAVVIAGMPKAKTAIILVIRSMFRAQSDSVRTLGKGGRFKISSRVSSAGSRGNQPSVVMKA
jgi:hypothetical protein